MKAVRTLVRLRATALAAVAAILVVLAAGGVGWTLRDGGSAAASADQGAAARLSAGVKRIPLNAHQCQIAQSMLADARKNRPQEAKALLF